MSVSRRSPRRTTNGHAARVPGQVRLDLQAADHAEVHLVEPLFDEHQHEQQAPRLIDDRAAESNKPRDELAADGIQLVTPHRKHCRNIHPAHDCRAL